MSDHGIAAWLESMRSTGLTECASGAGCAKPSDDGGPARFYGTGLCFDCEQREKRRAGAGPQLREFIPAKYKGRGFTAYDCPPGDAAARDRVAGWDGGRGLMLWSQTKGTGKSHLAFALLQARAPLGRIAALEWTDYLDKRKAAMQARCHDEGLELRLAAMRTADVALIDDIGSGRMTEWALAELWSLVSARYQSNRPTIVTCNYAPTALRGRLAQAGDQEGAERIVSRLAEMCEPVEVKAADYRLRRQG